MPMTVKLELPAEHVLMVEKIIDSWDGYWTDDKRSTTDDEHSAVMAIRDTLTIQRLWGID